MSEFNYKKYLKNNPLLNEGEEINEANLPKKGSMVKLDPSINLVSLIDIKDQDLEVIGYEKSGLIGGPSEFLIVKDAKGKKHEINPEYIQESVNEEVNEEEELTFTPSSGTMAGGTFSLNNRKYELTSPIKDVTIGGRYVTTLPKGTILYNLAGGLLADHESLKKFESPSSQYFDKSNYSGIMIRKDKEVLNNIIDNSKVIE